MTTMGKLQHWFRIGNYYFLIPYQVLTNERSFAPALLVVSSDRGIEPQLHAARLVESLVMRDVNEEEMKRAIERQYEELKERVGEMFAEQIKKIRECVLKTTLFYEGYPYEDEICGFFAEYERDIAHVRVGANRYMLMPVSSVANIIIKAEKMSIPEFLEDLRRIRQVAYKRITPAEVRSALRRLGTSAPIHDVIDELFRVAKMRAQTRFVMVVLTDGKKHYMIDFMRLLQAPSPAKLTEAEIYCTGNTAGFIVLKYEQGVLSDNAKRGIKTLTADYYTNYVLTGRDSEVLDRLYALINMRALGRERPEMMEAGIEEILGGGGGAATEEETAEVETEAGEAAEEKKAERGGEAEATYGGVTVEQERL